MSTNSIVDEFDCSYCGTPVWMFVSITTAALTILGNVFTISAILLSKKLSSMLSNYFIFSLAVSDFFVGCFIPYHMLSYIIDNFGDNEKNCLLRFVLTSFACSSSVCNLLFIALDRYLAVVYPLHYTRYMTRRTVLILIAIGWIVAMTVAIVPMIWNEWRKGSRCEWAEVMPSNFINFVLCPMFVLIWTTMLLLYTKICREASGQAQRLRGSLPNSINHVVAFRDSKSFQVMLIILGSFTICWLPHFVITIYSRSTRHQVRFPATCYEIAFNLAMVNSSINPIIYAWKNTTFRQAFLRLVRCKRPDGNVVVDYVTDHVPSKKNSMNGLNTVVCHRHERDAESGGGDKTDGVSTIQCDILTNKTP